MLIHQTNHHRLGFRAIWATSHKEGRRIAEAPIETMFPSITRTLSRPCFVLAGLRHHHNVSFIFMYKCICCLFSRPANTMMRPIVTRVLGDSPHTWCEMDVYSLWVYLTRCNRSSFCADDQRGGSGPVCQSGSDLHHRAHLASVDPHRGQQEAHATGETLSTRRSTFHCF